MQVKQKQTQQERIRATKKERKNKKEYCKNRKGRDQESKNAGKNKGRKVGKEGKTKTIELKSTKQ